MKWKYKPLLLKFSQMKNKVEKKTNENQFIAKKVNNTSTFTCSGKNYNKNSDISR